MTYDPTNVFAKIMRGDIPCKKVHEDKFSFAFHDIEPAAPVHVLVVPKGEYVSLHDFSAHAPANMIRGFWQSVQHVAKTLGLSENGYRVISNHGPDAAQTVPHCHVHILGGRPLGQLLAL